MNPDILGFTETSIDHSLTALYQMPGFNMFNQCRSRYEGRIALYVSSKYQTTGSDQFSIINSFSECLGFEIEFFLSDIFMFMYIYRPPSDDINGCLSNLLNTLTLANDKKYKGIFALGDFNFDLLFYNNNYVQDSIYLMHSFSLFPLITRATRVTMNTAALTDHIWSKQVETNVNKLITEKYFLSYSNN